MKKIFSLLLVFVMVLSLCACGGGASKEDIAEPETNVATPSEDEAPFQVQTELTGDNTLVIEGKQYALPMSVKAFMEAGWNDTYNHMDEKIDVDKGKQYPSFALDKNGEEKISGIGVYNHTDKEIAIEQGTLISLKLVGVPDDSRLTQCSFALPTGITEKSTYDDVLAAYGTKNESENYRIADDFEAKSKNAENFKKYGFTVLCNTKDPEVDPYNYYFAFHADKTIKYVEVTSIDYKSAAAAAFNK